MSKHTPGPWAISSYRDGRYSIVMDNEGFDVAKVDYPNQQPNARLIAAAPDLLEALIRLRHWAEADQVNYTGDHPVALARAAIAKATGGSDD